MVSAEKEIIGTIPLGKGSGTVQYRSTEEGFYAPNGPFVNSKGILYFIPTTTWDNLIVFQKGLFSEVPFPEGWPQNGLGLPSVLFKNQQGSTIWGFNAFRFEAKFSFKGFLALFPTDVFSKYGDWKIYSAPWGYIIDFPKFQKVFSIEGSVSSTLKMRTAEETRSWIETQPGGFSIGADGYVYKDKMLYSAMEPSNLANPPYNYLGRLASGHVIWAGGGFLNGSERYFVIATPSGTIEITLELPWAPDDSKPFSPFNYGLGSWGELYCLIAPFWDMKNQWPPEKSSPCVKIDVA